VFATIGAYSVTNSMSSVVIMIAMGIGGYFLRRVGIEAAPIALGLILGPIAEREFTSSLLIAQAQGSYLTLVMRPISAILVILCLASIISPLIAARRQRKNLKSAGEATDA
ncbi:MAG: tripartite tricarboxylate transporter permease, partial [Hyphomicrobiales bacterium]